MSAIPSDGLNELKAALRKRANAIEQKPGQKSENVQVESDNLPPPPESEEKEVFVESKVHRKGSKVYKNHGWKFSRSDSCSSTTSSSSVIIKEDVPEITEEVKQETVPVKMLSPNERKNLVDQKYNEIIDLLSFVGIDVKEI